MLYNAKGWLHASRENPAARGAGSLLQESSIKYISELFNTSRGGAGGSSLSGSVAGLEGSHALRRVSSMRRAFTRYTKGINAGFLGEFMEATLASSIQVTLY